MNSKSNFPLLKIAGLCALFAGSVFGQGQGQLPGNDSLSQGQEYYYGGGRYQGLTSDVVLNGLVEMPSAAMATVNGASSFLTRRSSFGTWKDIGVPNGNNLPNGFLSATTSTGLSLPNLFLNEYNLTHGQKKDNYLAARVGPFWLTNVMGGAAAMYNDVQGTFPNSNFNHETDNWTGITWLSATLTAYITDRFAITVSPWLYYLPLEGQVGWAAGSGFIGLNSYIQPQSMAQVGFHLPIGRWDISFYDQFQAYFLQDSILSENFFISAQASDLEPVDPAGRFQFGGFGPGYVDMTGDTRLSSNNQLFRSDRFFFRNNALFSANTAIGASTSFTGYYGRYDFWNDDMEHQGQWDTAGAMIAETEGNFRPFAAYQSTSDDSWSSSYHWLLVGAASRLNPQITAYSNVGYLWAVNGGAATDQDSWLGTFGLRHQISPYTSHSIEFGRSVTDPEFNARTRSDYASYMINQILGPRLTVSLFAMHADRTYLGSRLRAVREHSVTAVGSVARVNINDKSNLSIYAAFERFSNENMDRGWDLWTYRANYYRRIGQSTVFNMMYQYQDAGRSANPLDSFSEHLIYAGIMKQF